MHVAWQPFVITALMLGMVNLGWQVYWSHLTELDPAHLMEDLRNMLLVQIVHDWLALLACIHYSGGVDSPLVLFFILHLAMAQLALDRKQGWLATALAIGSLGVLLMSEALDLIPPVSIPGLTSELHQTSGFYVANVLVWQALVLILLTVMLQGVMYQLRRREEAVLRTRGRLEKANRRITQQSEERVRLLHAMAHELRSPIAAAITMIKVLVMTHGDKLPPEAQHPLDRGTDSPGGGSPGSSTSCSSWLKAESPRAMRRSDWTLVNLLNGNARRASGASRRARHTAQAGCPRGRSRSVRRSARPAPA